MSLEIAAATIRLGGRIILEDVSLEAGPGELIFLLGPNGSGKTTLLRAIAGLVPSTGIMTFDGLDLRTLSYRERARRLAYLPQGHVAHWPIAAREAVAIGRVPHTSSLSRLSSADTAAVARALANVDATVLAERPITELSGGERARVMLARALAVEAALLLADEPIASLDPAHQLGVLALLEKAAKGGGCVLAAIHDLALASRFATRVAVLDRRRIVADGPPASVLTPDLLAKVFAIRALEIEHEGSKAVLPWSTQPATE